VAIDQPCGSGAEPASPPLRVRRLLLRMPTLSSPPTQ
jgi:hypothetical protein